MKQRRKSRPNARCFLASVLVGIACSSTRYRQPTTALAAESEMVASGGASRHSRERVLQVRDFMLDVREVSVGDFRKCVQAGACRPRMRLPRTDSRHSFARGCRHPRLQRKHLPVNCISFNQANEYCAWKGERLPTADEWMWEARGGDEARPWPWGTSEITCSRANVRGCDPGQRPRRHLRPVESAQVGASRNGALNLVGNVEEMVEFDDARFGTMGGSFHLTVTAPLPEVGMHTRWSVEEYGDEVWGDAIGFRCARDL